MAVSRSRTEKMAVSRSQKRTEKMAVSRSQNPTDFASTLQPWAMGLRPSGWAIFW